VLLAIARHYERIGGFRHSAETGAGRTTLLFSHLSDDHVVFALDAGESLSQTQRSPLLQTERVRFVEGPTQKTLPRYEFDRTFQAVLIDGPHGYPFPDLEYYYFYPHLAPGGLLIIDDIQIPSIGRMLEIVRADPMFEFLELVGTTAFLGRTDAPAIDPCSDSWWLQPRALRAGHAAAERQPVRPVSAPRVAADAQGHQGFAARPHQEQLLEADVSGGNRGDGKPLPAHNARATRPAHARSRAVFYGRSR
jgi:hypothetical protein